MEELKVLRESVEYPQIGATVSDQLGLQDFEKSATVSDQFVTNPEVLIANLSFYA